VLTAVTGAEARNAMTEAKLRQLYPRCFNDERKPLKIGMHLDIHDLQLRAALRAWVQHPDYLNNITTPGAIRIDLNGRPAVVVTDAERQWTLHRPIIPVREPAVIAADARARGGNPEKIATTTITGLHIGGIDIRSRYAKAHEYEVLRDAVLRLAPDTRGLISDIFCDSNATWTLTVTLRESWNESRAMHIGALLSEAMLYVNGGHNSITLTDGLDHKPSEWAEGGECTGVNDENL
jgi:ProQ/FINO family